jgi:hypothetical protein
MAAFGFAGGFTAWFAGEALQILMPDHLSDFAQYMGQEQHYIELVNSGEISEAEAESRTAELRSEYAGNPYVKILADESLTPDERDAKMGARVVGDQLRGFVQQVLFFAIVGVLISLSVSVGDSVVSRNVRGVIVNGSVGMVLGMTGGVIVSLFINQLYRAMLGQDEPSLFQQIAARTIGWAILGGFLTIAPGVVLKNLKRLVIGLAGGVLGGTLGGLLFDPLGYLTDSAVLSRLVAISAIGLLSGLGTGVIESVAKTGWLQVVAGLIAGKQFILYKNPTLIGSSPQCEIYLFKDTAVAPQHAAIHRVPDGYYVEDQQSGSPTIVNGEQVTRTRLRNGDSIQIGSTVFAFHERG